MEGPWLYSRRGGLQEVRGRKERRWALGRAQVSHRAAGGLERSRRPGWLVRSGEVWKLVKGSWRPAREGQNRRLDS